MMKEKTITPRNRRPRRLMRKMAVMSCAHSSLKRGCTNSRARTSRFAKVIVVCNGAWKFDCAPVSLHHKNANFVWPGAFHLAGWLIEDAHFQTLKGKRVFELGAATGCLSIFLKLRGALAEA